MAKNTVSFIDPTDANALQLLQDSQKAQRNQELALLLKKRQIEQGNTLGNTQMVSGIAIRNSPLAGLAQLLQTYNADKNLENADTALAKQQLAQETAAYNRFAPTTEQPQAMPTQQPIAQDTAITALIPEPQVQSQVMPAQQEQTTQSFTPPPTGLKSPFSFDANVPPPNYGGQPINIANQNGQISQLSQMLKPPVNDVRPLPIAENQQQQMPMAQGQSPLAQLIANPNVNIQAPQPQRQINPYNALGLDQKTAYAYSKFAPDAFYKANLEALSPTNLQKENQYLGIPTEQARQFYIDKAKKDSYIAPNELKGGSYYDNPMTGQREFVAPTQFDNDKTYFNPNTGQTFYNTSPANNPEIQGKIAGARKQAEASIENRNSFIDTIDPATGNKKSITKEQALNQGGIVTGLGEANTQLQKDYAKHYADTQKDAFEARRILPKVIETAKLALQTPTGQGTVSRNEIANKLAVYGIKLPNKDLSKQQLLQARLATNLIDYMQKSGGARGFTETETKQVLNKAIGDLDTNPSALFKLITDTAGELIQRDKYGSSVNDNFTKNNGFGKYNEVFNPKQANKNALLLNAFSGDKSLRNAFFMSLSPEERKQLLNKGK